MKKFEYVGEKCLNPDCGRSARSRGLCDSCYQTAHSLVNRGKTTWEDLEKRGKCKPTKRRTGEYGQRTDWLLS